MEGWDFCGLIVGSSGKQWENFEVCFDWCFVYKNCLESEIKMVWFVYIEIERIVGIWFKLIMFVYDDVCEKRGIFQGFKGGFWKLEFGMFDCGVWSFINLLFGVLFQLRF